MKQLGRFKWLEFPGRRGDKPRPHDSAVMQCIQTQPNSSAAPIPPRGPWSPRSTGDQPHCINSSCKQITEREERTRGVGRARYLGSPPRAPSKSAPPPPPPPHAVVVGCCCCRRRIPREAGLGGGGGAALPWLQRLSSAARGGGGGVGEDGAATLDLPGSGSARARPRGAPSGQWHAGLAEEEEWGGPRDAPRWRRQRGGGGETGERPPSMEAPRMGLTANGGHAVPFSCCYYSLPQAPSERARLGY